MCAHFNGGALNAIHHHTSACMEYYNSTVPMCRGCDHRQREKRCQFSWNDLNSRHSSAGFWRNPFKWRTRILSILLAPADSNSVEILTIECFPSSTIAVVYPSVCAFHPEFARFQTRTHATDTTNKQTSTHRAHKAADIITLFSSIFDFFFFFFA